MAIPFVTTLDDSQFQAGLKNMEKGGKGLEGLLSGSFSSMAKGIGASMAAAFTVDAIMGAAQATITAVKAALDFVGQLQDQAEALGVNTEKLQGLEGAMATSGVSTEKFTLGMATLSQNVQQAKNDTGTARNSFEALGITFENIQKDPLDELILKIADGLKNAKDPAAAFAAALDLLGTKNIKFVAGLKAGRDEVEKLADSVEKLSNEDVALLAKAGDDIELFGKKVYVSAIKAVVGLSKYNEEITTIGASLAATIGLLPAYLLAINAIKDLTGGGTGTSLPETNGAKPEVFGPEYTPTKYNEEGIEIFPKTSVDPRRAKEIAENAAAESKANTDLRNIQQKTDETNRERDGQASEKRIKQTKEEADFYKKVKADMAAAEMRNQKNVDDFVRNQKKQAAQDDAKANIKQADKNLQQAQKDAAIAAGYTSDARTSLTNALMGNPDAKLTSQERQVNRLMDKAEGLGSDKQEAMKIGKVGGNTALDEKIPGALSTKRGVGKALKELQERKAAEKAAKEAEDKALKQQEDMVKALQAIDRGINGG